MNELPRIAFIEQRFPRPKVESIAQAIQGGFSTDTLTQMDLRDMQLAIAVGSRGIANLAAIVRETVTVLKARGAEPFIVPAMGSHGGGTPEGQQKTLEDYGVTENNIGAPVRSSMETICLGETNDGIPVHIDRIASESDGIIVINRIKPHTDFHGVIESGILKMITIGLGNRNGALACHANTSRLTYDQIILSISNTVIAMGKNPLWRGGIGERLSRNRFDRSHPRREYRRT